MFKLSLPFVLLGVGCAPPPAPEGLDAAARYMVRNFWEDDATFEAGVQGFLNWFEDEGKAILGLAPCHPDAVDCEEGKSTDAFTVTDLLPEDIAALPLDEQIVEDTKNFEDPDDDVLVARDVSKAAGVVSLVEMDCTWIESEALLARPDQDKVFPLDWQSYKRTYATPRKAYDDATSSSTFDPIDEAIDPYADDFDSTAYEGSVMLTDNVVDPTKVFGLVDIGAFPMDLEFRHGIYNVAYGDEAPKPTGVFAILTYDREAVWDNSGNGLAQSYSLEINAERPNGKTLRMLTVWAEPRSGIVSADDPIALNTAVGKARDSSVLLSKICSGEEEIEGE